MAGWRIHRRRHRRRHQSHPKSWRKKGPHPGLGGGGGSAERARTTDSFSLANPERPTTSRSPVGGGGQARYTALSAPESPARQVTYPCRLAVGVYPLIGRHVVLLCAMYPYFDDQRQRIVHVVVSTQQGSRPARWACNVPHSILCIIISILIEDTYSTRSHIIHHIRLPPDRSR